MSAAGGLARATPNGVHSHDERTNFGTIALAAGGTGGHLFPAEALAAELDRRGYTPVLVTDARGRPLAVGGRDMAIHRIQGGGLAGKSVWAQTRAAFALAFGAAQAFVLLGRIRPRAVVGFGGYASFPTVFAAWLRRIPAAIHEQNAVLGRANRLLARGARRVATSFAETAGVSAGARPRAVRTGMPVRPQVTALSPTPYRPPQVGEPIALLVIGGSQGARVFADVIPAAIARLPEDVRRRLRVAQQCRPEDLDRTWKAHAAIGVAADLTTFFADAPERMAAAQLVIARAGASTVAELCALGRPSILVPYRYAADDHQSANARALVGLGAAWVLPESDLTPDALAALLARVLADPHALARAAACARAEARPDAARVLADAVVALIPAAERIRP